MMKRDPPGAQPERLLQSGVAPVLTASRISCHLTEALAGFRNQHVEEEILCAPAEQPRPWLHRSFMALSARREEKGSVTLCSAIYIGPRESTLAHNISFERSSYGEPQQDQIPPKAPFNELL